MLVVQPGAGHPSEMATIEISKIKNFTGAIDLLSEATGVNLDTENVKDITFNIAELERRLS